MKNKEKQADSIVDSDGNPISGGDTERRQSDIQSAAYSANDSSDEAVAGSLPDQTQHQLQDAENRVMRAHAELDNFRKRTRREMDERAKFASLGLMNDLLTSIDSLQLAIQAVGESGESGGLLEGVQMVCDQLIATLAKHGCEKIEAVGQRFDPNMHEAVQMQPNAETPANHVSMEVRSGYKLHDRVIRPTQVFVSTGPE